MDQKQDMIKKVTEAIISVEGEGGRPVIWVSVRGPAGYQ